MVMTDATPLTPLKQNSIYDPRAPEKYDHMSKMQPKAVNTISDIASIVKNAI